MKINTSLHQSIDFPFALEVTENPQEKFCDGMKNWEFIGAETKNILVVTGKSGITREYSEKYIKYIKKVLNCNFHTTQIKSSSSIEARQIDALCALNKIDLIISLGGGSVIDTTKYVTRLRKVPLLIIPTALSSDCIASPISVITNDEGKRESIPTGLPSCIFIDLNITKKSPLELTLSGIGDIISNASAILDLRYHEEYHNKTINGFSKLLSKASYELITGIKKEDINSSSSHQNIATALILSGLSMGFSGNSLPCSGAEHLISHSIDKYFPKKSTHGIQVAIGTIYCNSIRKLLGEDFIDSNSINFIKEIGIPSNPNEIGIKREEFIDLAKKSLTLRPGRLTILSKIKDETIFHDAYSNAFE